MSSSGRADNVAPIQPVRRRSTTDNNRLKRRRYKGVISASAAAIRVALWGIEIQPSPLSTRPKVTSAGKCYRPALSECPTRSIHTDESDRQAPFRTLAPVGPRGGVHQPLCQTNLILITQRRDCPAEWTGQTRAGSGRFRAVIDTQGYAGRVPSRCPKCKAACTLAGLGQTPLAVRSL